MHRTTSVKAAAILVAVVVMGRASPAAASPTFPAEIRRHVGTPSTPPCTLCHSGNPGVGTATTPFAAALRSRGLVKNDTGSLDGALDALAAEMTDSDCDGVPDVEELRRGTDPNTPDLADGGASPGASCGQPFVPTYGCAVMAPRAAFGGGTTGAAAALLLAAAAMASRRSRARGGASFG